MVNEQSGNGECNAAKREGKIKRIARSGRRRFVAARKKGDGEWRVEIWGKAEVGDRGLRGKGGSQAREEDAWLVGLTIYRRLCVESKEQPNRENVVDWDAGRRRISH